MRKKQLLIKKQVGGSGPCQPTFQTLTERKFSHNKPHFTEWWRQHASNNTHTFLYMLKLNRQLQQHFSSIEIRRRRNIDVIMIENQRLCHYVIFIKGKWYLFILKFFIFCLCSNDKRKTIISFYWVINSKFYSKSQKVTGTVLLRCLRHESVVKF